MKFDELVMTVYIFHHMPKCGGTAVKTVLSSWFDLVMDYISIEQLRGDVPIDSPIPLNQLNDDHCICSHFETSKNNLFYRYPELLKKPNDFKVFSLVREPLELRISLYYYEIKEGRRCASDQSLSEYLKLGCNYISKRLKCSTENYKNIIDRYTFIGIQEYLQDSIDIMSVLFEKKSIVLKNVNVSSRDNQYSTLNENEINMFLENNKLDYMIYSYAKNKFKDFSAIFLSRPIIDGWPEKD